MTDRYREDIQNRAQPRGARIVIGVGRPYPKAGRLGLREQIRSDEAIGQIVAVQGAGDEVYRAAMGSPDPSSLDVADSPHAQPRQRCQLFLGQSGRNPIPTDHFAVAACHGCSI